MQDDIYPEFEEPIPVHPRGPSPIDLLTRILLCLIPYERVSLKSPLSLETARHRVDVFIRSPQPLHLENKGILSEYMVTGKLKDSGFELWSPDGIDLTCSIGPFVFPAKKQDKKYNRIPFVRGEILPAPSGSSIRVTLRPPFRDLLVLLALSWFCFMIRPSLAMAVFGLVPYAFIVIFFKLARSDAITMLKILFRAK
jgi:hypothetical protein